MAIDFHGDMDKYLAGKRRKKAFSGIKSKIMNKKAVVSYKAMDRLGGLKNKVVSKVDDIRNKKKEEKQISQDDINNLVEKKGINIPLRPIVRKVEKAEEGWKEVDMGNIKTEGVGLTDLEVEKQKIQDNLVKVHEKRELEKEKIANLSAENEQRETEEEKAKRLALEEEVKILKEKQRIEEDRLSQLKRARRIEQMDALRGRVTNILFKKMPKREKDMGEVVRKEIRREAKVDMVEKRNERPKEDVTKVENNVVEQKEEIQKGREPEKKESEEIGKLKKELEESKKIINKEKKKDIKKEKVKKKKKPDTKKQSFLSRFIQIKTSVQIAREEEERLKMEEERALKDQAAVSELFQGEGEVMSNAPKEESANDGGAVPNMSTLFPGEQKVEKKISDSRDTIALDDDYKIKVVRNG